MTDQSKHTTALVAGGAGFIGAHLCRRLLADGMQVICMDNLQTGSMQNISALATDRRFRFVHHDIVHPMPQLGTLTQIYNLACPASPRHYQATPLQTTMTCVQGTVNLLNLAHENHCTLLQASTSEVYGDASVCPQQEQYWGNVNPTGIRACYDEGKRCAETLCMDHHRTYGTSVKIIRIFNTYGPHMAADDGRVVSNFIVQALRGEPLTIHGTEGNTHIRSFQYIDDLVEAICRMMQTAPEVTGPVNIGNPEQHAIGELADIVLRLTGSASPKTWHPIPADDPHRRQPDITLATRLLNGWQPKVSLEEGLKKTIEYFRNKYSI